MSEFKEFYDKLQSMTGEDIFTINRIASSHEGVPIEAGWYFAIQLFDFRGLEFAMKLRDSLISIIEHFEPDEFDDFIYRIHYLKTIIPNGFADSASGLSEDDLEILDYIIENFYRIEVFASCL